AQLLGEHAQAQMAEPRAPVGFRDGGAGPAHGGNRIPEPLVVGLWPLEHPAHGGGGAALAQELAGLIAQFFQVVAEIEIHRLRSSLAACKLAVRRANRRDASAA